MKKLTAFCLAVLMAMTLVACGGDSTLDTSDAKAFATSLDAMYEELGDAERADLLYYFPVVFYKGAMAEELYSALGRVPRFSDEMLLQHGVVTIEAFKTGFQSLLDIQAQGLGPLSGENLKELNGVTAAEITKRGEAIMEMYREE